MIAVPRSLHGLHQRPGGRVLGVGGEAQVGVVGRAPASSEISARLFIAWTSPGPSSSSTWPSYALGELSASSSARSSSASTAAPASSSRTLLAVEQMGEVPADLVQGGRRSQPSALKLPSRLDRQREPVATV